MCKHLLLISLPFHDLPSINDTCMNQLFHCGLQNCYFLILSLFLYQLAFLFLLILLQYSCFTVLGQCLLCSKVNQLYIYIYPFFFRFPFHCSLPWWLRRQSVCLQCGRPRFNPWVRKIFWRRKWQPTPVLLPGKFHGWRSRLVGYSPWVAKSWTRLSEFNVNVSLQSPESTEQRSLCCTEGSHQLSILRIVVYIWRRQQQPTPVFLPGESQGWGSFVGCHLWGRTELDTNEGTQQQQQQLCTYVNPNLPIHPAFVLFTSDSISALSVSSSVLFFQIPPISNTI